MSEQQNANRAPQYGVGAWAQNAMQSGRGQGAVPAGGFQDHGYPFQLAHDIDDDFVPEGAPAPAQAQPIIASQLPRTNVPVPATRDMEATTAMEVVKPAMKPFTVEMGSPPTLRQNGICFFFCPADLTFRTGLPLVPEPIPLVEVCNALPVDSRFGFLRACAAAMPPPPFPVAQSLWMLPPWVAPQPPPQEVRYEEPSHLCAQSMYRPREHQHQQPLRHIEEEEAEEEYPAHVPTFPPPEATARQLEEARRELGDFYTAAEFQQWKRKCRIVVHGLVRGETFWDAKEELAARHGYVQDKGCKHPWWRCDTDKFGVLQCLTLQSVSAAKRLAGTWIDRPGGHHWEVRQYHSRRGQRKPSSSACNAQQSKPARSGRRNRGRGRRGKKGGSHHNRRPRARATEE